MGELGIKNDTGKLRWDLLPLDVTEQVVAVLTKALRNYPEWNWVHVKDARKRYLAATFRHIAARLRGEVIDPDDNEPHLAHAICDLMFLAYFDLHDVDGAGEFKPQYKEEVNGEETQRER